MFWFLILIVIILVVYNYGLRPLNYWKKKGVTQGKPWLFLGDSWKTTFGKMGIAEFIRVSYDMFPNKRYAGIYQGTQPTLIVRDPDLIKMITVKDFDHFTDHNNVIEVDVDPLWGGNLISLKGEKWRDMRTTISPIFTSSKIKIMFTLMSEAAENFVKFFLDKNEDVVEVDLKDIYTRYTNDVIATMAFGIKVDSLTEPENEFYKMGREITTVAGFFKILKIYLYFLVPKICKFFKMGVFSKSVSNYFTGAIDYTIKTREENGISRPDLINLFLEARKGIKREDGDHVDNQLAALKESFKKDHHKQHKYISNTEITAQALIFFFAGFDTVSTALCFGSFELATNKDVQDKLREEIQCTWDENDGKITYDILQNMKYLDMVISEMLRKWPPAIVLDRRCTKSYTIHPATSSEKNLHLKEGEMLWIPTQGIHYDPAFYPDPEKFDPERFSHENKDKIKPYTYLPFGTGPRSCIGNRFALVEVKVLLFYLLRQFEIVPIKKTVLPLTLSKSSWGHTVEGGFWFGLKKI